MERCGNHLDSYSLLDDLVMDAKDSRLYAGAFQKENSHQSKPVMTWYFSPLSSEEILKEVKFEFH